MIQSVFPINGTPPTVIGAANTVNGGTTVIGQIIGQLTGLTMALTMSYFMYTLLMHIHRVGETSQILTQAMTTMGPVRIGFAAIMMLPLQSGFSLGQQGVITVAGWGIGMGRTIYTSAIQALGPDAMVIAQPAIPGTGTIVLNLLELEFCRSLVNQASGTASQQTPLVPLPTITKGTSLQTGTVGNYISYNYNMAPGNGFAGATCGTITVTGPAKDAGSLAGVNIDMTGQQQTILDDMIATIRPITDQMAANYWTTKNQSALNGLLADYKTFAQSYTALLTQMAQTTSAALQAAVQNAQQARAGNVGLTTGQQQQSNLGWSSAGAYFLEFTRLNGQTLGLATAMPIVNAPSFEGLSKSLKHDIAPLYTATISFLSTLKNYVDTNDGVDIPGGNGDIATARLTTSDGQGLISNIMAALNISPKLLSTVVSNIMPTGSVWSDPFGGLITMGQTLINASLLAYGAAGILSSPLVATGSTIFNVITGNWAAAAVGGVLSTVIQFFSTPIFLGLLGLLVPGLMIAYVLPMIPWIMWIAGIIGYLILVCEAVISVPLWMLAHMTLEGEGLHGNAMSGYELLFNILFRPTLMLLGLFMGYFIFTCTSWLIRQSFGIAAGFTLDNGWFVTNFLGLMVLLAIFTLIHIAAAIMSFRLITQLPHHIPRILGFSPANRVDAEAFAGEAAYIAARPALGAIGQGLNRALSQTSSKQNQLPSPQKQVGHSGNRENSAGSGQNRGIDNTFQATTDISQSREDE
jgi:conjugal transfer/type IV secretion protein DotA/TraY